MDGMELSDIVCLAVQISVPVVTFAMGINLREYHDAKKWVEDHKTFDIDIYKERLKSQRDESFKDKIWYYVGSPGRYLALK